MSKQPDENGNGFETSSELRHEDRPAPSPFPTTGRPVGIGPVLIAGLVLVILVALIVYFLTR